MRSCWAGYRQAVSFCPYADLERRGVRHLGVCLLARIDGTSPVDYLPEEEKRERVRRLARSILLDGIASFEQAWPFLQ